MEGPLLKLQEALAISQAQRDAKTVLRALDKEARNMPQKNVPRSQRKVASLPTKPLEAGKVPPRPRKKKRRK